MLHLRLVLWFGILQMNLNHRNQTLNLIHSWSPNCMTPGCTYVLFDRFSTLSLPSNTCSAPGMSFLSAVSLGQISNLSVIELPIFHHEIWDSRDYRLADDHGVKSSASRMNSSHSVPNFKAVSNNIRNSPGYVNDMRIKEWNFLKRVFRSRLKSEADAWLRNAQFEKELKRYRDEQMTGVKLALLGE